MMRYVFLLHVLKIKDIKLLRKISANDNPNKLLWEKIYVLHWFRNLKFQKCSRVNISTE